MDAKRGRGAVNDVLEGCNGGNFAREVEDALIGVAGGVRAAVFDDVDGLQAVDVAGIVNVHAHRAFEVVTLKFFREVVHRGGRGVLLVVRGNVGSV